MKRTILLFVLLLLMVSCGNSTPDDSDVKEAARAAIIHNLKDPSSAKFHHNELVKDLGNNEYSYAETVNATNSFGGSIAQNAVVKLRWNGNDPSEVSNWSLLDLQMLER